MAQSTTNCFRQATVNNLTMREDHFPSELSMEAFLWDNPCVLSLEHPDDREHNLVRENPYLRVITCELSLSDCRAGNAGRLDMLVRFDKYTFGILELKKHAVGRSALRQLCDYLAKAGDIIEYIRRETEIGEEDLDWNKVNVVGMLVGGSIDPDLATLPIMNGITQEILHIDKMPDYDNAILNAEINTWVDDGCKERKEVKPVCVKDIPVYGLTINRYKNNRTNEYFVFSNTYYANNEDRDYTKYLFENQTYNKARLVNAVVRAYVEKYRKQNEKQPTVEELKKAFPDSLQGSFGVFIQQTGADSKRYYTSKGLPIQIDGVRVVTCSQWKKENIQRFLANARKKIGYTITELDE